jgi:hypothetical protein
VWQDSGIGIISSNNGNFAFFAAVGGSGKTGAPGKLVGTMSNPLGTSAVETSISDVKDAPDATIAQIIYQGGGPIYRDPASGMFIMFSHNERVFNGSFPGTQYYSWLGILKSMDGGDSWTDCGAIITPHHSFAEMAALYDSFGRRDGDWYNADIGWGPYVIVDGYFYVHYWDNDGPIMPNGLLTGVQGGGVARALVSEVVTAAAAGTVSVWHKYNAGTWTELGIRGTGSRIVDEISYSVSYNTHRNRHIMMRAWEFVAGKTTFRYRESLDGITWSDPPQLFEVGAPSDPSRYIYPTLVDPSSPEPHLTGQAFYLIAKNWDTGEVDRFLVTLTGDPIPPSSSPGGPP